MADSIKTIPPGGKTDDDRLWKKLLSGVSSAVELRVVTIVSEAKISGDLSNPKIALPPTTTNAIATSINLVSGDITSVVPEQFWSPEQEIVRQYHQQQIDAGHQIIERNIRLIGEVGEALAKSLRELAKLESQD